MISTVLLSHPQLHCLTLLLPGGLGDYLGYRFMEGEPVLGPSPARDLDRAPVGTFAAAWSATAAVPRTRSPDWRAGWLSHFSGREPSPDQPLQFQAFTDGSAVCRAREPSRDHLRELFLRPVEDGVRLWMRLTAGSPIEGGYCVQQCLRFSGSANEDWRREIAQVPYLSEFEMQSMGRPNATLSWIRRRGDWASFPVPYTAYHTPGGEVVAGEESAGQVDHGLVVRESPHRDIAPDGYWGRVAPATDWEQVAAGMYWERTALVSNRHPADCLHSWIEFGPLAEGESRTLRGKIYYLHGGKDDLLRSWKRDFG